MSSNPHTDNIMDLFRALKLKYNPINWAVAEHDYTRKQEEYLSAFASSYIKPETVSMSDITAAYAILALSNLQHQQREPGGCRREGG